MSLFFFFSSRRRHTRLQGDWSSDVCSSDLAIIASTTGVPRIPTHGSCLPLVTISVSAPSLSIVWTRSEERRVGKECRYRGRRHDGKKQERADRRRAAR